MAIICREHKLLFIMVPGTGCSVIGSELQKRLGGIWLPDRDILRDGKVIVPKKHNTMDQIVRTGLMTKPEVSEMLVFATVRNPFDRFTTYYQRLAGTWYEEEMAFHSRQLDRERVSMSAEEVEESETRLSRRRKRKSRRAATIRRVGFNPWLMASLVRWKVRYGSLREQAFPMLSGVDVVIRYERLEQGLNEILARAGVGITITLPRKNVTPGKRNYKQYYSAVSRIVTEHVLSDDLRALGYGFEGPISEAAVVELVHRDRAVEPVRV